MEAQEILNRYGWIRKIRPAVVSALIADVLISDRRRIVITRQGVKLKVDPLSDLGWWVLSADGYEPETARIMRYHLMPTSTFLDVGANEGIWSVYAAQLVGPEGLIIAVEPQQRLQSVISTNMELNSVRNYVLFQNALGGGQGDEVFINLFPSTNNGASSIVWRYRFARKRERVEVITPEYILERCGIDHFDFVKIDVEGFEHKVLGSLQPLMIEGRVRILFVDYHVPILRAQGISPDECEEMVLKSGMVSIDRGDSKAGGYHLYRRKTQG